MKEIALLGTTNQVFADVLGALMAKDLSVNAMVDFPERVMLNDTRLTVSHLPFGEEQQVVIALDGYDDAVLTYNDNLEDRYTNDMTLRYFVSTVTAARKAGVKRIVVIGSPVSEAFFVTELRRLDDIDWVFISTEGDFAARAVAEVSEPRCHRQVYTEG